MWLKDRVQKNIAMLFLGMSFVAFGADSRDLFPSDDEYPSCVGSPEKRPVDLAADRAAGCQRAVLNLQFYPEVGLWGYPNANPVVMSPSLEVKAPSEDAQDESSSDEEQACKKEFSKEDFKALLRSRGSVGAYCLKKDVKEHSINFDDFKNCIVLTISLTGSLLTQSASENPKNCLSNRRNPDRRTCIFSGAQRIEKGEKIGYQVSEAAREKFNDIKKLAQAIYQNDRDAFTQLHQDGIDPNWSYVKFGLSPLCMAVQSGAYSIVDLLITQGIADVHEDIDSTFKHDTILCATYRKVRYYRENYGFDAMRNVIDRLVHAGANVLAPGAGNATPLSLFAACDVIPNKHAFPILHTLLSAIMHEETAEQARMTASECANRHAEQIMESCSRHAAMLRARALFIENYPGKNPLQTCAFDLLRRSWSRDAIECSEAEKEIEHIQTNESAGTHALLTELLSDCNEWPIEQPKSTCLDCTDGPISLDDFFVENTCLVHSPHLIILS